MCARTARSAMTGIWVLLATFTAAPRAEAGSVATTWTCTTNNWGQTSCWSVLNGGDAYPDNGAATYAVTLPDGGANYTLTMAPGSDPAVTIDSLDFQNTAGTGRPTLSISAGRTLTILDSLTSRGQITTSGTFTVAPGAVVNIDQGNLRVQSGGTASVPVTTYTTGTGCGGGGELWATGSGSFLDISSLTTINQTECGALIIRAELGGEVDASSLSDGGTTCSYEADDPGSILHLDSMTTLTDAIVVTNGGTLIAGPITALNRGTLFVGGVTSVFDESQISSVSSSNITAASGATLNFPLLTSSTNDSLYQFRAQTSGVLEFPNLTTVNSTNLTMVMEANSGGTLNLPALTTTLGGVKFEANGNNSVINIPSISTLGSYKTISAISGGRVNAAPLQTIHGLVIVDGSSSVLDVSQVSNADQASIYAQGGAHVELPILSSYLGTQPPNLGDSILRAEGSGSVLSLPATASFVGGPAYGGRIHANFGGTVSLPALQSMSDEVHLQVANSVNSLLVLGVVNLEAGFGCSVSVTNGGTIRVLGDYSFATSTESNWTWSGGATLEMAGQCSGTAPVSLEVGGTDLGVSETGYTANFHLDRLRIGAGALVKLVDAKDNGNRNGVGGAAEALYVDTIQFADAAGRLYTNGLHLYYHTLVGDPGQIGGSPPTGVCDDGNVCTTDSCSGGVCTHVDECAAAAALYEPGSWSCPPAAPGGCGFGMKGACQDDALRGPTRGVNLHSGEFTEAAVDLYIPGRGGSFTNDIMSGLLRDSGGGNSFVDAILTDLLRDAGRGNSFVQDIMNGLLRDAGRGNSFVNDIMAGLLRDSGGGNSFVDDIMTSLLRDSGGGNSFVNDIITSLLRDAGRGNSFVQDIAAGLLRDSGGGNSFVDGILSGLLRDAGGGNSFVDVIVGGLLRSSGGGNSFVQDIMAGLLRDSGGGDSFVTDISAGILRPKPVPGGGSLVSGTMDGILRPLPWANGGYFGWLSGETPGARTSGTRRGMAIDEGLWWIRAGSGGGQDLAFARKYRSRTGPTTAMGNGWDFSYNIYLQHAGADMLVHDGWSRADVYEVENLATNRGGNPTWTKREFFRKLEQNPDNTFTLTFADRGKWNFHPLDSGPSELRGKISSIVDRPGNTNTFAYDGTGKLTTVTDPLGRAVTLSYHAGALSDYIESVCDFTGRCVTYAHYDGVETGGSVGDLKSVTSPAVTGTPTGNDFPSGKTITYKYSSGNADEALNHNLTEIIDGKGQTFLVNTYSSTTNSGAVDHDHVVTQQWGSSGQTSKVFYAVQTPSAGNGFATVKAVVNDRVGNVSEHFYDAGNRLVRLHEYTGRATPGVTTTDVANRPTNPLRPGDDPAYFETQFEWNVDSLPTEVTAPNQNVFTWDFDEPNLDPLHRGDLLTRTCLAGPLGGDQASLVETFEYGTSFGGFPTKYTDPRGHDTIVTYGAEGNLTSITRRIPSIVEEFRYNAFGQLRRHIHPDNGSGHRRVDKFNYYGSGDGVQNGYLKNVIIDALHDDQNDPPGTGNEFQLTTTFEYNATGAVTKVTDPKGGDAQFVRNSLNQAVRTRSREVTLGGGVRYERDYYYDANNNLVRVDVQNKNEAGALQANAYFTTVIEREILNRPTKICREAGAYTGAVPGTVNLPVCAGLPDAEFVSTAYQYDANRNLTLVQWGEAVEGRQPNNAVACSFDERDLLYRVVGAPNDAAQSSTQFDYDPNGNVKRVKAGLEDVPGQRVSQFTYDGFNRLMSATDPMGNVGQYHYDPNGNPGGFADAAQTSANPFAARVLGELTDVAGSGGNVRLAEVYWEWDEEDRPTRREVGFFHPVTQAPLNGGQQSGKSLTTIAWSDGSQVESVTDDNLHATTFDFDSVMRLKTRHDAKANTITYGYDANSNVTSVTELDKSDLGAQDQVFVKTWTFDGLDRSKTLTDNIGTVTQYFYDSRHHFVRRLDGMSKESGFVYDGLGRRTATVRDLDGDGASATDVDDTVRVVSWDDSSRRISRTDDNGNTKRYAYDALNRRIVTQVADGTIDQVGTGATWPLGNPSPSLGGFTSGYDVHGNVVTHTDANGTVVQSQFDLDNRTTSRAVTPGPGVSHDTLTETYQYDGAGRLVSAEDDDSLVTFGYDSMSNVIQDVQTGESVISNWDGWNQYITVTYPGGRVITHSYDALNRLRTVSDAGGAIASYDYIGPGRVERRVLNAPPNETAVEYTYDGVTGVPNEPGDLGVKRIVRTKHFKVSGGAIIDERTYAWDSVYNKTQRKDVRAGGPGLDHLYECDPAHRLIETTVTNPAQVVERQTAYTLDGEGNRLSVAGAPDPGDYALSSTLPDPADLQCNQYTSTPFDAREYDDKGNLTVITAAPALEPPSPGNTVCVGGANNNAACSRYTECPGGACYLNNRFLSITPSSVAGPSVIQVTVVSLPDLTRAVTDLSGYVGDIWYLGAPTPVSDNPPSGSTLKAAVLQCGTAELRDWSSENLVHIYGAIVVPYGTYEVRHCAGTGGPCSAPLTVQTARYGDVAPPLGTPTTAAGQPNFQDISALVAKFQGRPGAISKARAKLQPNVLVPSANVSFLDISVAVTAFQGQRYSFPGAGCPAAASPALAASGVARGGSVTGLEYDYRDQMVGFIDSSGVQTKYQYDALGRRVAKIVDASGTPQTTRFLYHGLHAVEETDASSVTQATYVYGKKPDTALTMQRGGVNYYYHADDLGNIMAVTNVTGSVVERYDYYDFGAPLFLDASGNPTGAAESTVGNPHLAQAGGRYDAETGFYFTGAPYLDPAAGRSTSRKKGRDTDPLDKSWCEDIVPWDCSELGYPARGFCEENGGIPLACSCSESRGDCVAMCIDSGETGQGASIWNGDSTGPRYY